MNYQMRPLRLPPIDLAKFNEVAYRFLTNFRPKSEFRTTPPTPTVHIGWTYTSNGYLAARYRDPTTGREVIWGLDVSYYRAGSLQPRQLKS